MRRIPASSERVGYSGIGDALKRDNYQFDKLVLAQTNEIPADATMIVVAGPRTDLLEQEVPILEEYLVQEDRQAARHARPVRRPQAAGADAKVDGACSRSGESTPPIRS